MKTKDKTELKDRIKSYRKNLNLSQAECAECAGIERKTINRIENGHYDPSLSTLLRLATVFGVPASTLIKDL